VNVKDLKKYEHDLFIGLDREEKILASIRESKDFSDETKVALSEYLEGFVKMFEEKK
jgi:F0F1-type ATP synthase alpha subunit